MSKTNSEVYMKDLKVNRRNETDDEILPVFAQFLWTLKFIFSQVPIWILFGVISGNYSYL